MILLNSFPHKTLLDLWSIYLFFGTKKSGGYKNNFLYWAYNIQVNKSQLNTTTTDN